MKKHVSALLIAALVPLGASAQAVPDQPSTEERVNLSPFVITGARDTGYAATSTLAGTRLKTNLADVGSSISVVTQEFLADTAATNIQDLLIYTTNTEVGGAGGNFSGTDLGFGFTDETVALRRPQSNSRVRGLDSADNTRDFFLTDVPFDSYNTEQVEIQRGPNAILFGLGSPAGIINTNLIKPRLGKDAVKLEFRVGSFDSTRALLDVNKVLIKDELAIRFAALSDREEFRQQFTFENDERLFGTLTWDPKFLRKGIFSGTTLRANYEDGTVDANRPRVAPPRDQITAWWTIGKPVVDPTDTSTYDIPGTPFFGNLARFAGRHHATIFSDHTSSQSGDAANNVPDAIATARLAGWVNAGGPIPRETIRMVGIERFSSAVAHAASGIPFGSFYKDQSIIDRSIFDYVNNLIDGPNKFEWQEFDAISATLEQFFFSDRSLGFELGYHEEFYTDGHFSMQTFAQGGAIHIDINSTLIDGTPNPNFGRPFAGSDSVDNFEGDIDRRSARATAFYRLDLRDRLDGRWGKILGHHTFTGFYNEQTIDRFERRFWGYATGPEFGQLIGLQQNNQFAGERGRAFISYLGPSLADRSSPVGANIPGIQAVQTPTSGEEVFYWNRGAQEFRREGISLLTHDGDKDLLYQSADKSRNTIDSSAFVWQSHWFDDTITGILGWRSDDADFFGDTGRKNNPKTRAVLINDPGFRISDTPSNSVSGNIFSWSVGAHAPERVNRMLPFGSRLSVYYNESENFSPAGERTDVFGRNLPPPTGTTKDYGITASAFDGKLVGRLGWYESASKFNTRTITNQFWIGSIELQAINNIKSGRAEEVGSNWQAYVLPPAEFMEHWNFRNADGSSTITLDPDPDSAITFQVPTSFAQVADTVSKGLEAELTYNPVPNWRMMLNVSQQKASQAGAGRFVREWIDTRIPILTAAGDVPNGLGLTTQGILDMQILIPLQTAEQQDGGRIQELREWRWNFINNYSFTRSFLKGVSVGGALRWQDEAAIGFPVITDPVTGADRFDTDNPYQAPAILDGDFWIGYSRSLMGDRVGFKVQLNVRNALRYSTNYIPIAAQPDGSLALVRITPPTTWELTTTFSF